MPKASAIIIIPRKKMEYIAPFFKNMYFLILSIFLPVNSRKTNATRPFPIMISGTERVKAKAPRTPSIEKVMSIISK